MNGTRRHPMDLTGKVAVVTGGNRGIGLAIAQGLCASGCAVAIWGRDRERNEEAARSCREQGGVALPFACDVQDERAVKAASEATLAALGRIDGLFANAGTGGGGRTPFHRQTDADWSRMFDVNVMGARRVVAAVLDVMLDRLSREAGGGGRIVLTSSVAARLGTAYNQHYAATKAALVALARGLAVEYGRHGITVNALLPGYVQTEMIESLVSSSKFNDVVLKRLPLRRLAEPREIAGAAIYLMSDLSSYHTADALTIDGGFCAS